MSESAYSRPEIYELAFSFRDYPKAVDFLTEAAAAAGMSSIGSMVELGCGPGQYCLEFARRGVTSFGVDLSPEMVAYTQAKADDEKLPCQLIEADMRAFSLPQPLDLAVCMMATFHLLRTNRDVIEHFDSVADNLTDMGLYIIELSHPKDMFSPGSATRNKWTMDDGLVKVDTEWGCDAVIDPLTEINTGTVHFKVKHPTLVEEFSFQEQWREIPAGLIRALIELSGRFKIAAMYGDLDMNVPFDNSDKAWRMVIVLRKM